ncbi:MAG: hypothetical protein Roseis2KO_37720 [Roseivirga sp.]
MLWLRKIGSDWKHFRSLPEMLLYDLNIRVSGVIYQIRDILRSDDFSASVKGAYRIGKRTNVSPRSIKL